MNIKQIKYLNNNPNKIIIYVHGLGSNKEMINRFSKKLLEKGIGIVSFDQPCHGEDKTDFKYFNIELCIKYLNNIIDELKNNYNSKIYLFGSSFGGFVILNKLLEDNKNIEKSILMSPAINFYSIIKRKMNIDDNYFNNNKYLELYNDIKLYKDTYFDIKKREEILLKTPLNNVYIIQGNIDKTVYLDDIKNYTNNIKIIDNGKHELYDYEEEIVEFILNNIEE